jgi:uncharacterized protein (TIRG00374 family)
VTAPTVFRRAIQLTVSLIIGALCLWFAFRGMRDGAAGQQMSADTILDVIKAIPASAYAWSLVLFAAQTIVRVERWRLQVRGLTGTAPGWRDALTINAFAFAAVFLLPFRLGEFVRPNLCAQRGIMTASAGLASSALERIIDGLVTTAIFGCLLLLAPFDLPPWVRAGGVSALAFFGAAVVFLVVALKARSRVLPLVERMASAVSPALATRIVALINSFLDGLRCFASFKDLAIYVVLSTAFWLLNGASTGVIVSAIDPNASPFAGLFCLCFLVIGVMIPAPPGNVGTFHAFAKLGLTVAGVGAVDAVASAVVLHAFSTLSVIGLAVLFAIVGSVRWREASHALDDT